VLYRLSDQDADTIEGRRQNEEPVAGRRGNRANSHQQYPARVVAVFPNAGTSANLQVYLDGNDQYWATSAQKGDGPGQWLRTAF
jgi:hypothetical protein